jgi:glutathione S-transferase
LKLYYAPGACSQAPHIILLETGLPFEKVRVDLETKRTESGADYLAISPKGAVPALELDDGALLTENAVILQYIADQAPGWHLIPPYGTMERYRVLEWLNYIATELHKSFAPLFHPTGEPREHAMKAIATRFDYVEGRLGDDLYLTGEQFGVADAYLFVVLGWARVFHFDFTRWPALRAFRQRVGERPAVRAALHAEGLAP